MKSGEAFPTVDCKKRSTSASAREQIPHSQDNGATAAEGHTLTWTDEFPLQHTLVILLLYCLKHLTQTHHIYAFESFEFYKAPQAKHFTTQFLHFTENISEHATTTTIKYMSHSLCSLYNSNILMFIKT